MTRTQRKRYYRHVCIYTKRVNVIKIYNTPRQTLEINYRKGHFRLLIKVKDSNHNCLFVFDLKRLLTSTFVISPMVVNFTVIQIFSQESSRGKNKKKENRMCIGK